MGLSLRDMENSKIQTNKFKNIIKKKFKYQGLHLAYFVQNKIFTKYYSSLVERFTDNNVKDEINLFVRNIDKYSIFVSGEDLKSVLKNEIQIKIHANTPETFIISSWGDEANLTCEQIIFDLKKLFMNKYDFQDISYKDKKVFLL